MSLTRDQILHAQDIKTKEINVPEWGDTVFIRQLTRGEQDAYLKRQFGATTLKQDARAKNQEINVGNIYGHDAYLCSCGLCEENGRPLFSQADIKELEKKNGAVIGRLALEILEFSEMREDAEAAGRTEEEKLADDLKN